MTEEQKHNHIKKIAEDYVSKCWTTFLDLDEVDLVSAGIGVGKIIAKEYEDENAELKKQIEKMKCDVHSLIKDRMNDDIDQNIIERLAEKWEIKEK